MPMRRSIGLLMVKSHDEKATNAILTAVQGKVRKINLNPSQSYKNYVKTFVKVAPRI